MGDAPGKGARWEAASTPPNQGEISLKSTEIRGARPRARLTYCTAETTFLGSFLKTHKCVLTH